MAIDTQHAKLPTPIITGNETVDLSAATVDLPPHFTPTITGTDTPPESPLIAEQAARIEVLTAANARLEADNARLRDPLAENYQVVKQAAFLSGVPRQTLENWAELGKVKHEWRDGRLWIDVIDAIRQRFLLAPKPPI